MELYDETGLQPGDEGKIHGKIIAHDLSMAKRIVPGSDRDRGFITMPDGTVERITGYPETKPFEGSGIGPKPWRACGRKRHANGVKSAPSHGKKVPDADDPRSANLKTDLQRCLDCGWYCKDLEKHKKTCDKRLTRKIVFGNVVRTGRTSSANPKRKRRQLNELSKFCRCPKCHCRLSAGHLERHLRTRCPMANKSAT